MPQDTRRFTVRPSVRTGVGVFLLYVVVVTTIQALSGLPYDEWGDSPGNLLRGAVLSLVVGGGVVALTISRLGWWRPVLRDDVRGGPRWTLLAPGLFILISLGNLGATDWGDLGTDYLLAALALGVTVGFAEEVVNRGALLVGLRGSVGEVGVWAGTCALFALMHATNILLGASVGDTAAQMVSAAAVGSALYVLRRLTGSLVWAMAMHGLDDFSVFVNQQSGSAPATGLLGIVALPLAVVAGLVVAVRTSEGTPPSA